MPNRQQCCIIAIRYTEPEWIETKDLIEQCGVPIIYVDRNGTGPMAEAYNRGFLHLCRSEFLDSVEFVWFVSNVTFDPSILKNLVKRLEIRPKLAAVHPSFDNSDHKFCRPDGSNKLKTVPFVEFTAPMVRRSVFEQIVLDENMPYWGHDLDWGHRVRMAGHEIAVDHKNRIYHTYNRDLSNEHPDTLVRRAKRQKADGSTIRCLTRKYGHDWRKVMKYVG